MTAILGNVFNIMLFLTVTGSVFTALSLLAKKAFHISLPLWFSVCGIAAFIVPVIMPSLWLVPPEEQLWASGYHIACIVWLAGVIAFAAYYTVRVLLARRALKKYAFCENERVNSIYRSCMETVGLKKAPVLYFGTLQEPACVVSALRPAVILNEEVILQLSDEMLTTVLCHELMHIKRGHHIFRSIFDAISVLHCANPFVWIAKNDFAANCETDCDKRALSVLEGRTNATEYARTMLYLMELSLGRSTGKTGGLNALGFLLAKQRMFNILNDRPCAKKRFLNIAVPALFLIAVLAFSVYMSRGYFYPYPAYNTETEYAVYADTAEE